MGNVKAQEALKAYHVAFILALDGILLIIDPPEEFVIYEQRQQKLRDKVAEAWEYFQIEL